MKKKVWAVVSTTIFALIVFLAFRWADRNNYFALTTVRVDNSFLVDSAEIAEILRPCFGISLLDFSEDSLLAGLGKIAGVRSVSIDIDLPNTIILNFSVKEPAVVLVCNLTKVPVTSKGENLPINWGNGTLPEIQITRDADSLFVCSSIDLLLKRKLENVSIFVDQNSIVVFDGETRILLNPNALEDSWLRWLTIKTFVTNRTDEVDLRFVGQAILRSPEES